MARAVKATERAGREELKMLEERKRWEVEKGRREVGKDE